MKHCNPGIEIRIHEAKSIGVPTRKVHTEADWPTGKKGVGCGLWETDIVRVFQTDPNFSLHMQNLYKRAMDANKYDGTCRTNFN